MLFRNISRNLNIDITQCQNRPKLYSEFRDKFEAKITSEEEENMTAITTCSFVKKLQPLLKCSF